MRLLTRREYASTVADLLGIAAPDVSSLPVEPRVSGFDNNAAASVVTSRHADGFLELAAELTKQALQNNRAGLVRCDGECAQEFVREFGARAFRRPLSDDEQQRYLTLFASDLTQGAFDAGVELAVTSMLTSPHFLYRAELGASEAGEAHYSLSQHERASALSYLFWGTMPDATLSAAADAGELASQSQLAAQAERLLEDPRAEAQLADFATQWLRTEGVLGANKDAQLYPNFTDAVRTSMMAEQARFFQELFLRSEGDFTGLFQADYSFVDDTLAAFYGISSPGTGGEPGRVALPPDSERGGILGLGSVLAAHAHQNESSPIKRGLFVRDRLLCQDLPAPPQDVDTTPPGLDPSLTTRERFALHTQAEACNQCHKFIDGVGFGLEGFDGVGARRSLENGLAVDESGEVLGLEGLAVDSLDTFQGPRELGALLADSESAQRCLATQYFRYAGGRHEAQTDVCNARTLADRFVAGGLKLPDLLVAFTQLKTFTTRQEAAP